MFVVVVVVVFVDLVMLLLIDWNNFDWKNDDLVVVAFVILVVFAVEVNYEVVILVEFFWLVMMMVHVMIDFVLVMMMVHVLIFWMVV